MELKIKKDIVQPDYHLLQKSVFLVLTILEYIPVVQVTKCLRKWVPVPVYHANNTTSKIVE